MQRQPKWQKLKEAATARSYLKKETSIIKVKPFQIDKYPVTNAEFAEFVKKHPQWQKGKVSSKQAEPAYLKHWVKTSSNSYAPKPNELKHPVTNVSWFAANAYCTAQGKRLPTIDQWEFAGLASATTEKRFCRTRIQPYHS